MRPGGPTGCPILVIANCQPRTSPTHRIPPVRAIACRPPACPRRASRSSCSPAARAGSRGTAPTCRLAAWLSRHLTKSDTPTGGQTARASTCSRRDGHTHGHARGVRLDMDSQPADSHEHPSWRAFSTGSSTGQTRLADARNLTSVAAMGGRQSGRGRARGGGGQGQRVSSVPSRPPGRSPRLKGRGPTTHAIAASTSSPTTSPSVKIRWSCCARAFSAIATVVSTGSRATGSRPLS